MDLFSELSSIISKFGSDQIIRDHANIDAIHNVCRQLNLADNTWRDELIKWSGSTAFATLLKNFETDAAKIADRATVSLKTSLGVQGEQFAGLEIAKIVAVFLEEYIVILASRDPQFAARLSLRRHREILDAFAPPIRSPSLLQELPDKEPPAKEELELHSLIDTAVQHLQRGRAIAARELLLSVRSRLVDIPSPSPYLKSRIAGNLGCSYLQTEEFVSAKTEFERAWEARESSLSLSNIANALLLCKETVEALKFSTKSVGYSNRSGQAVAVHLHALSANSKLEELTQLVESDPLCKHDPECIMAQGNIALDQENYQKAEDHFRNAFLKSPYDPQIPFLIGLSIAKPIYVNNDADMPIDGLVTASQRKRFEEVEELMTQSITLADQYDYPLNKTRALLNRSSARQILGNELGSESDCAETVKIDPNNQLVRIKIANFQLHRMQFSEAVTTLNELNDENKLMCFAILAEAYIGDDKLVEAKNALSPFLNGESDRNRQHFNGADAYLRIAEKESKEDEYITELFEKFPDNGDVLLAIAKFRRRQKRRENALELLQLAEKASYCTMRNQIKRERAQVFIDMEKWAEAAEAIGSYIQDVSSVGVDLFQLVICLANKGDLKGAHKVAKQARDSLGKTIPTVTEIKARYEESGGNLQSARGLILSLMKEHTLQHDHCEPILQRLNRSLNLPYDSMEESSEQKVL